MSGSGDFESELRARLGAGLDGPGGERPGAGVDGERIAAVWQAAQERLPGAVEAAAFAEHLAARAPESLDAGRWLEELAAGDLYLACACARGVEAAVVRFDADYGRVIEAVARRYADRTRGAEDLAQVVRMKLLVGDGERPGRIADYSGLGFLENFVRVTAVRACLDQVKRGVQRKRETPASDQAWLEAAADAGDLELEFLKREYRAHFREAFAAAAAALSSEERNALRQHLVHRLTVDQIAAVYHVHRATAARRVARAREALLEATRRELAARLGGASAAEVDSIMKLIDSRFELSVSRLLATRDRAGAPTSEQRGATGDRAGAPTSGQGGAGTGDAGDDGGDDPLPG
jgi:RNA polymerase sigma-70 factor, ECF subfamily